MTNKQRNIIVSQFNTIYKRKNRQEARTKIILKKQKQLYIKKKRKKNITPSEQFQNPSQNCRKKENRFPPNTHIHDCSITLLSTC